MKGYILYVRVCVNYDEWQCAALHVINLLYIFVINTNRTLKATTMCLEITNAHF